MRRHWCVLAAMMAVWSLVAQEAAVSFHTEEIARPRGVGSGWTTARDPGRLSREFVAAEHEWRDGRLEWRFTPRQGTRFNDLFRMFPIAAPFTRIEVTLANPGAPFTLCAKMQDTSGAEWVASRHPLATSGQEQTVTFAWRDWALASWTNRKTGPMLFPLTSFALIAFDIEGGRDYHVQIRGVRVVTAVAEVTDVRGFAFPEQVDGDSEVAVTPFEVGVRTPLRDVRARLSLQRGEMEMASVELRTEAGGDGRLRLSADAPLRLAWLMRGGDYDVVLHGQGSSGELEQVSVCRTLGRTRLRQVGSDVEGGVSEVRLHHGVPTLFIDGKPHTGMSAAAYGPSPEKFASFTQADVDLFTFCASPTEGYPGLSSLTWLSPDTYDYTQLEQRVAMVLGANRQARIFPRLYLHAPAWWSERHPDDIVIAERPTGERYVFMHRGVRPAPSWASEAWRRDTAEGLRRLIRHIETSPYANNFIGYHLASGITEEWMMWGSNENEWVDYSPVNQAKFRTWLRERYGDDESLRRAWNSRAVSLETAEIPSYRKRAAASFGSFRDPAAEQDVIDYYTYNSWLVADTITYFAKVVKDATRRRKTVGVFYGYLLQLGGGHRLHNAGHLALRQVLESPDIDFVCSPTSYAFRQLGGLGTTHFMSLVDSVRRHGKLWFDENDVRTSISPGTLGTWGKPADIAGDKVQQDKELACVLTAGVAQWWFDVGSNRYDVPELRAVVRNLTRVAQDAQRLDRTPSFQAALVVDAPSIPYMKVGDRLGSELLVRQLPRLHRAGFPVGHALASDLDALQDCRLLVMSMAFAPDATLRRDLDRLRRDGRVIVFMPGSGLYSDGQFRPERIKEFTGVNVRLGREPVRGAMTFTDAPGFCDGLAGTTFGADSYADALPLLPDDGEAIVLARLSDGRPAVVARRFEGWTAVYCAQPQLPAALWRNLGRLAGVHSYIDEEDVVYANASMVSVVATRAGRRTIRLPRPRRVTEMIEGRAVTDVPVTSFEVELRENQTAIFGLEP